MLTPKEIETKVFTKAKVGYMPEEVNDFLDQIYADFSTLLEEREVLNKKLLILNDRFETFKKEQSEIKNTMVNAQKSHDDAVKSAKTKADKIVYEAQDFAKKLIEAAKKEAEYQKSVNEKLNKEVEDFKEKLLSIYESHVKLISSIPVMRKDVESLHSENLELLKAATADAVTEQKTEEAEDIAPVAEGNDLSSSDTVVIPTVAKEIVEDKEPEFEPIFTKVEQKPVENSRNRRFSSDFIDEVEEEAEDERVDFKEKAKATRRVSRLMDGDDEDFDDDDDDYDEDEVRGLFGKKKKKKKISFFKIMREADDDDDDDDYDDDDYE